MLDLSVILPTYNRSNTLLKSIHSVLFQTQNFRELIVIDDGSTDGTAELVKKINDPRIVYVKTNNNGQNSARNKGLKLAKSEWVAFHDSDDVMLPNKLEIVFSKIFEINMRNESASESIALFHPYIRLLESDPHVISLVPQKLSRKHPNGFDNTVDTFNQMQILSGNFMSSQTLVIGRNRLLQLGGWDENLKRYTDWDLAIRISQHMKFVFICNPLVVAYVQADSASMAIEEGHVARRQIFEKHLATYKLSPHRLIVNWLRMIHRKIRNK